jgi:diamine N-acetyltransferase
MQGDGSRLREDAGGVLQENAGGVLHLQESAGRVLRGERVWLRGVEPGDLEFMFRWENDPEMWRYGDTEAPYSREVLRQFIENQRQYDIFTNEQMRFVICRREGSGGGSDCGGGALAEGGSGDSPAHCGVPIGFIDLFDLDPADQSAGVGLVICDEADRGKGYASEAVDLLVAYSERVLELRRLYCNIRPENFSCIRLFRGKQFVQLGKPEGQSSQNGAQKDEIILQRVFFG